MWAAERFGGYSVFPFPVSPASSSSRASAEPANHPTLTPGKPESPGRSIAWQVSLGTVPLECPALHGEREFFATARPSSLLKRLARPEEVAAMIAYICSAQASATTGAVLRVDGGVVRVIA